MRKVLTIMWKDVTILFRDWAALILIIAGPLVLTIGMGLVTGSFNRDESAPAVSLIPVAIVDQDGGQFATALTAVLMSDELGDLVAAETVNDTAAAQARVEAGEIAAAVIIPPGFSNSFMPDMATGALPEPVAVELIANPASPIRAGIITNIVEEFTIQVQSGIATIQISLSSLAAGGRVAPAELPNIGQALGEQLFAQTGSGDLSAASLISIRRESAAAAGSADFNPLAYFAPAMALLFLMYAVTLGARSLLVERREGTLARMLAAPVNSAQILSGKIAGIFLGGVIQLGVLIILTSLMFQLNWGNPLGVVLLVVAAAAAATGWGLLVASLAGSAGQISNLGMALTLIFGILGGSFVSLEGSSAVIQWLSRLTPNRWALDGFTSLALGEEITALAGPLAALLVMAVVLFVTAALIFSRRQTQLLGG